MTRPARRVVVSTVIDAAPARVWQALTDPAEVQAWDGSVPVDVPAGYPTAGQRARWRSRLGPVTATLHDEIRLVEPERRLAATLTLGFIRVDEEYLLAAGAGGGTVLVSDNAVTSTVPGLGRLAGAMVRRSTRAAMAALGRHCTQDGPPPLSRRFPPPPAG